MYYVYSLKCRDGYYIGFTVDLRRRLKRHFMGWVPATKDRRPVHLDFYFAVQDKYVAHRFEKYLKSASGRAFTKKRLSVH